MPDDSPAPASSTPEDRAAQRGARVAFGAFLLLCFAFIISSTWQIARGVFFEPPVTRTAP